MNAYEAASRVWGITVEAIAEPMAEGILEGDHRFEEIAHACRARMLGVGADQYSEGEMQKFEGMAPSEIVAGAREELLDLINYAAMTIIRLEQVAERIEGFAEPADEPDCVEEQLAEVVDVYGNTIGLFEINTGEFRPIAAPEPACMYPLCDCTDSDCPRYGR